MYNPKLKSNLIGEIELKFQESHLGLISRISFDFTPISETEYEVLSFYSVLCEAMLMNL